MAPEDHQLPLRKTLRNERKGEYHRHLTRKVKTQVTRRLKMAMFANKINTDGNPICPMAGCGLPVMPDTGEGQANGIAPDVRRRLFEAGVLDNDEGSHVIIHKECAK